MICILRSARICVSDTVIPTLLSRTLRALCLLPCVKALAYTPRCVLPCNCWAGSGLPFPWGFDSTTALLPPSPQWCLHLISPFSNSSSSISRHKSPLFLLPQLCLLSVQFSLLSPSSINRFFVLCHAQTLASSKLLNKNFCDLRESGLFLSVFLCACAGCGLRLF